MSYVQKTSLTLLVILGSIIPGIASSSDTIDAIITLPQHYSDNDMPSHVIEWDGEAVIPEWDEVWFTDGTDEGTRILDLPEGYDVAAWETHDQRNYRYHAFDSGKLYFRARKEGMTLRQNILVTDGETIEPVVEGDIVGHRNIQVIAPYGDRIAYTASVDDGLGARLFLVDEDQPGGARQLTALGNLIIGSAQGGGRNSMAAIGQSLYFAARDEDSGESALYKLDQAGNASIIESYGVSDPVRTWPRGLIVAGDDLYFQASDEPDEDWRLWIYRNGDLTPLTDPSEEAEDMRAPLGLIPNSEGDRVFFLAKPWDNDEQDHLDNFRLAITDGTPEGTNTYWHNDLGDGEVTGRRRAGADHLIFTAPFDADDGRRYWYTDGTSSGTQMITINGSAFYRTFSSAAETTVATSEHGAWFFAGGEQVVHFDTRGLTSFIPGPEELDFYSDLVVIDDLAWFSANDDGWAGDVWLWRIPEMPEPESDLFSDRFEVID